MSAIDVYIKVIGSFVIVRTCLLEVYQNTQSTVTIIPRAYIARAIMVIVLRVF